MRPEASICKKFARRINDEVAAGQHFNYKFVEALRQELITPGAKLQLGIAAEVPLSLYDLVKPSLEVLPKLRLIYLLGLLEAFVEEYVAQRESVSIKEVPGRLRCKCESGWTKQHPQGSPLSSTSLLNLAFVKFTLHRMYGIDCSSVRICFWEAGPLRNCLVHDGGIIPDERYLAVLQESIKELGAESAVHSELVITEEFLWVYIYGARAFLKACEPLP